MLYIESQGEDFVSVVGGVFFCGILGLMVTCVMETGNKIVKAEYKCLNQEVIIEKDIYDAHDYHISVKSAERGADRVELEILEGYVDPNGEKYGYWPDGYHYRRDGYDLKPGYCIYIKALIKRFRSIVFMRRIMHHMQKEK